MKAAVVKAPGTDAELEVTTRPIPEPGPGEVVIRLAAAALNYRDLTYVNGIQGSGMAPFVLGSDGAGFVTALGFGVTGWKQGDPVIINAALSCEQCSFCQQGEHSLCDRFQILGGPRDGTMAEYVVVPSLNLHRKPDHLDVQTAAALPLALGTAWRALVTRSRIQPGEVVLIHGIGGGVAMYALQIAVETDCRTIVTSSNQQKLDVAKSMGAWAALDYRNEPVADRVLALTNGRGADLVVDGLGAATLPTSLTAVRKGGRIVHFGTHTGYTSNLHTRTLCWKQVSLIGTTMNSRSDFAAAVHFYEANRLQPMVSHRFPLKEIDEAVRTLSQGQHIGKVLVTIG